MNRRCRRFAASTSRAAIALLLCASLPVLRAAAQPAATGGATPVAASAPTSAPAIPLPPRPVAPATAIKTAPALTVDQLATMNKFVTLSVSRMLRDDEVDAAGVSRNDLIAASVEVPGPPSVDYLTKYMAALATALKPVMATGSVRARLNVAIVASRVAENSRIGNVPTTFLQPIASAGIQDKTNSVAFWSMKAAREIMASTPGNPDPTLLAQIPKAVQAHGYNGAIVEEAYAAMNDAKSPQSIAALMKLYKERIDLYANGAPSDPSVDKRASSFLTAGQGIWGKLNGTQKTQVMTLIAQMLDVASARAATGQNTPEVAEQIRTQLIDTGKAVQIVAESLNDTALTDQVKVAIRSLGNAKPDEFGTILKPVIEGVRKDFASPSGAVAKP